MLGKFIVFLHLIVFLSIHACFAQDGKRRDLALNSAEKNYRLGTAALDKGNYWKAVEYFDACLYRNHLYTEAYFSRATAKEWLNQPKGALTDYNILLELVPEHTEGIMARGILRYNQKQYELAKEDFLKFLTLPKGETSAVFFRSSMFERGTDKIMTAQGTSAEIYNYLGLTCTQLKTYQQAIHYFDSAMHINGQEPDYLINRGIARESMGDIEAAIADYEQALALDPGNALASYNLGTLATQTTNSELAIKTYTDVLKKDPTFAYAYTQRAIAKMESGDFEGALTDYDSALILDKTNPENWLNRGLAKEKLEDLVGAYNDFSQTIHLKPNHEKAYLSRANILIKLDKYEEAIQNYDMALFYYPSYGLAYLNRGIAKHNNKESSAACLDLKKAVELGLTSAENIFKKICKD